MNFGFVFCGLVPAGIYGWVDAFFDPAVRKPMTLEGRSGIGSIICFLGMASRAGPGGESSFFKRG